MCSFVHQIQDLNVYDLQLTTIIPEDQKTSSTFREKNKSMSITKPGNTINPHPPATVYQTVSAGFIDGQEPKVVTIIDSRFI